MCGDPELAEYIDLPRGIVRIAALRAGRIEACIFSGPSQNPPRWEVVRALFATHELDSMFVAVLILHQPVGAGSLNIIAQTITVTPSGNMTSCCSNVSRSATLA